VTISDSDIRALSSGSSLNGVELWFEGYVSRDKELDRGCGMVGVGGSRDILGAALTSPNGSFAVSSGGSSVGAGLGLHRQRDTYTWSQNDIQLPCQCNSLGSPTFILTQHLHQSIVTLPTFSHLLLNLTFPFLAFPTS